MRWHMPSPCSLSLLLLHTRLPWPCSLSMLCLRTCIHVIAIETLKPSACRQLPGLVSRVCSLGTMTKRHVAKPPGESVPRCRINETQDRKGYRVFQGKSYLFFFRGRKKAEQFIRDRHDQAPACRKRHVQDKPRTTQYRYVAQKKTKKKTVYYGVLRVQGSKDKQWTKKYFP